jgi:NADPH-dependent 2,4-dienoyl-CoA reductase/sulfur reductase-like enzyme
MKSMQIEMGRAGTIRVDPETLATNRAGVFAGGDVVTGPNYVVEAIAHGKLAAKVIDRYIRGEPLKVGPEVRIPEVYVPPVEETEEEYSKIARTEPPRLPPELSRRSYAEVELSLSTVEAVTEARRCLRCDLEFTKPKEEAKKAAAGGERA